MTLQIKKRDSKEALHRADHRRFRSQGSLEDLNRARLPRVKLCEGCHVLSNQHVVPPACGRKQRVAGFGGAAGNENALGKKIGLSSANK